MIQTRNMVASLLAVVLVATSTLQGSGATEYIVGNTAGWVVPNGRDNAFNYWAAEYEFHVGDTLVFNFVKGMHDVAEVSKEDYETCDASHAMSIATDGPAKIKLESAGDHYFICSFPNHCMKGQRVTIKVLSSSGGLESPSQSPSAAMQVIEGFPTTVAAAEGFSTTVAIVGMHSLSKQSTLAANY